MNCAFWCNKHLITTPLWTSTAKRKLQFKNYIFYPSCFFKKQTNKLIFSWSVKLSPRGFQCLYTRVKAHAVGGNTSDFLSQFLFCLIILLKFSAV